MKQSQIISRKLLMLAAVIGLGTVVARSQDTPPTMPPPVDAPKGTVIFTRDSTTPAEVKAPVSSAQKSTLAVTDGERDAISFSSYKLDVHLVPAESTLWAHAEIQVRNDSAGPLPILPLQISSSLRWENIRQRVGDTLVALTFEQQLIDTDADHTGQANEARIVLRKPLAPGASLQIDAIYSGKIDRNANRLERIGAPKTEAEKADWDVESAEFTGMRGFGNVLWIPIAAPRAFLGEGVKLFDAAGKSRLRNADASIRLRLTVEYTGQAPAGAIFCGYYERLSATTDDEKLPASNAPGVATVEFAMPHLGFRTPSLFLVQTPLVNDSRGRILVATWQEDIVAPYQRAAMNVDSLLADWLGPQIEPLLILDLPEGANQPFVDSGLLAVAMHNHSATELAPQLAHALTLQRFPAAHPWVSEGLAQFMGLLWTEQTKGRSVAITQLQERYVALALLDSGSPAQSLINAHGEIFFRVKAASVWWMLRDLVGETILKRAIQQYRKAAQRDPAAASFEDILEKATGNSFKWFFDDWVTNDKGLPDLAIVSVAQRSLGGEKGSLIAVEVSNDGGAVAEVPVTVHSGSLVKTERLRIPANSRATVRILFEGTPEDVTVNDGSVPEQRTSTHTRRINSGS